MGAITVPTTSAAMRKSVIDNNMNKKQSLTNVLSHHDNMMMP